MIIQPATFEQALPFLERAAHYDTTAGAATVADLCVDAQHYAGLIDGRPVMAYALSLRGPVAWVMAAGGGAGGVDLTRAIDAAATDQAAQAGARQIAMTTARPGLVRKLQNLGWAVSGVTMRKSIK